MRILFCLALCFLTFKNLSAEEIWIKGFGPVNFGDRCKSENKDTEIYNYEGFVIEADCFFKFKSIKNKIITFIKISTNNLSADTAKSLMLSTVPQAFGFGDLVFYDSDVKGGHLMHDTKALGITDSFCNNTAGIKNSIEILEFPLLPKYSKKNEKGNLHIRIWADKMRCLEKKKIKKTIRVDKNLKLNNELNSESTKLFMNNFK